MQDDRERRPGTSEVEATPDARGRPDATWPGETPGTAETEAVPDAGSGAGSRTGSKRDAPGDA